MPICAVTLCCQVVLWKAPNCQHTCQFTRVVPEVGQVLQALHYRQVTARRQIGSTLTVPRGRFWAKIHTFWWAEWGRNSVDFIIWRTKIVILEKFQLACWARRKVFFRSTDSRAERYLRHDRLLVLSPRRVSLPLYSRAERCLRHDRLLALSPRRGDRAE
jgi:hypothetical protein